MIVIVKDLSEVPEWLREKLDEVPRDKGEDLVEDLVVITEKEVLYARVTEEEARELLSSRSLLILL